MVNFSTIFLSIFAKRGLSYRRPKKLRLASESPWKTASFGIKFKEKNHGAWKISESKYASLSACLKKNLLFWHLLTYFPHFNPIISNWNRGTIPDIIFGMRSAIGLNSIIGEKVITTHIHGKLGGRSVFTSYHMIYYHLKNIFASRIAYQSMNITEPYRIEVHYWQCRVLEPVIFSLYSKTLGNWQVIYKVKLLLETVTIRSVINSFEIVCMLTDLNTVHRIIAKYLGRYTVHMIVDVVPRMRKMPILFR